MAVIIDTNFFLGLLHPDDINAKQSEQVFRNIVTGKFGNLYTTDLVVAELSTLAFIKTKGNILVMKNLHKLIMGDNRIATVLETPLTMHPTIWDKFIEYNQPFKGKKGFLSWVDVSLLVQAKNRQIDNIVTFDEHFLGFISVIK